MQLFWRLAKKPTVQLYKYGIKNYATVITLAQVVVWVVSAF